MVYCIGNCLPIQGKAQGTLTDPKRADSTIHIFDARSKIAAIGNKITGSGYEDISKYPFAFIAFGDIANIHSVRESYTKLYQIANDPKYS